MAFAIGRCSAEPDPNARLACYDKLAASLKAGVPLASPPAAQAYVPPQRTYTAPAPQAQPAPAPVQQAYVPPAQPAAPAYTPPPAYNPPAQPAYAPPPTYAQPPQPAYTPPAAPQPAAAPPARDHAWYDVANWFGWDDTAETSSDKPGNFGAENLPPPPDSSGAPARPKPLDHITATVTAVAYDMFGHFTVTLDNGQVWRQLDGDTGKVRFSKKGKEAVTISRGAIGSYNLEVEGHTGIFKVRRIK